jgi:ABC-type multidrug transport system ATPase subunit
LLNALAGQLPRAPGMRLTGSVRGAAGGGASQGFVGQDDEFFAQDSVEETLNLAAQLRLPRRMPAARKRALVEALIAQLGLARVAQSKVGGAKTRGISGGERKRLAIACEMLASPSLLFLGACNSFGSCSACADACLRADEPTSGLDSFSALSVMQSLKALASRGHTLVASIHQPRGSIWALFDDVVLLAEGGLLLYSGPAEGALAHLEHEGMACPAGSNPAEHLLDVAAIDYSSPEAEQASRARVAKLAAAWASRDAGAHAGSVVARPPASSAVVKAALPWWQQFRLLLARAWRQATRDTTALKARLGSSLSSALVFAAVFWRLDSSQAAIQSRLGLLQVCAVNTAVRARVMDIAACLRADASALFITLLQMSSLVKTLQLFPRERTVVQRERANGHYGVGPYFLAKLAAELPVGAIFPAIFGACVYPACGLTPRLPRFLSFLGMLTLESFSASAIGMTISGACLRHGYRTLPAR